MRHIRLRGFTAVELLVTIVVAVMLLTAGYQLYNTGIKSSAVAKRRAIASNTAYDLLQSYTRTSLAIPCSAQSLATNAAVPGSYGLPAATYTATIACPYSNSGLNKITVTISYTNPEINSVTRTLLVLPG